MKSLFLLSTLLSSYTVLAATADDWRSRTIYQVFTDRFARTDSSTTAPCNVNDSNYCGGTWRGLINNLDYIKNMGFTAVWISPVTANIDRGYHGFWQNDLYSVNSNFGTAQDLKDLASALHSKGMYLMVDIVANHMGMRGSPESFDASVLKPFTDKKYYNDYCLIENWQDQKQVEVCWLGDPSSILMPDLKTEDTEVRNMLNSWISSLVSDYSIDGLRIDSVKNQETSFWAPFCAAAGIFCFGELSDGNAAYTYPYSFVEGLDSITDYPMYYSIIRVFTQQTDMSDLVYNLGLCKDGGCKDTSLMGTFIENHDNERFPHITSDLSLAKNAIAYVMLSDGIPIIYQGQEAHLAGADDPGCREALWLTGFKTDAPLYGSIALLNQIRNTAMQHTPAQGYPSYREYQSWALTYSSQVVQLRKDPVRTILTNEGCCKEQYDLTTSGMGFKAGGKVVEVFSCDEYTANDGGDITVKMGGGEPKVLLNEGDLQGTGLCGH